MKIQYVSDLHLEFGGYDVINQLANCESDILVLAGDIFVYTKITHIVTLIYEAVKKPIIFATFNGNFPFG